MFGLGPWEIMMILAIVLILFGAGRLPDAIGQLRRGLAEFKKGAAEPQALPPPPAADKAKEPETPKNVG